MRLQGRVAVVTGGGSGIGRGICLRFAEEGAHIVVADVDEQGAAQTATMVRELGQDALIAAGDVSNHSVVESLFTNALSEFGHYDILVNNAGILKWGSILDIPESDWDRIIEVNLKSTFLCTREAARYWIKNRKPGKVVNTASVSGEWALPDQSHYCASKGGVKMFTKGAALDLAKHNINVNAIAPGGTATNIMANSNDPNHTVTNTGSVPLGRRAEPRDMANVALFLVSDDAAYLTGEVIYVTGGKSAQF